uniref:Uncharacterized protein n=1 Tax=Anguilla anguilla TaxID=7936 RepID=A0A0E9WBM2_ANGAN
MYFKLKNSVRDPLTYTKQCVEVTNYKKPLCKPNSGSI